MNTQEIKFSNNGNGLFTAQIITDGIGEMVYGKRRFVMNAQYGQLPTGQWIARALPVTRLGNEIRVTDGINDENSAREIALNCAKNLLAQIETLTKYLTK